MVLAFLEDLMQHKIFCVETAPDLENHYQGLPERALLAAVLLRSIRDLDITNNQGIRADAIGWFRGTLNLIEQRQPDRDGTTYFSFQDASTILGLTKSQREYIDSLVMEAEEDYGKSNTKREESREGISKLHEGKRYRVGKTHSTI